MNHLVATGVYFYLFSAAAAAEAGPVTTEFRVLGDLEVRVAGRVVAVGHARQQCVLAALLVDANRTVATGQLLDRVWAEQPPQRVHNVLHGYLSRLRRALSVAPDASIERQPGGYRLRVDPLAVDLHRFHRFVARARAASDEAEAVELFERALGLWRGTAFGALDSPWLDELRRTLDHARHTAELDRNDLVLGLDGSGHARLLAGLVEAAAAHPLDERLAGQLMLGLHRSGRPADALLHYEAVRARLAEELGTDPSPPLQALHKQMLTAGPQLSRPVPRQLPAPPRAFVGRDRELATLGAVLAAHAVVAVSGTAGVGKTALAVHWAHRVAERFPDGQLYVNLRGFEPGATAMAPDEAVRGFLDSLGAPAAQIPAEPQAQIGLYRSILAQQRVLVLLDNARDAEQVRPLLPGAAGCLVVVTSRDQLPGLVAAEGAHPLTLDLLSAAGAGELLANRLGRQRVSAEPDAVAEIIDGCARLPLALTIVAARAAAHPDFPLSALARELRGARTALEMLSGGGPGADVRAVFDCSYRILSTGAARLFRLLGLHPGPDVGVPAAASLAGITAGRARPLLVELAQAHLLNEHAPARYGFHDLLRAYAAQLVDDAEERHTAAHRLLDHYVHTAREGAELLNPALDPIALAPPAAGVGPERLTDAGQALAWFDAEHPGLLSAVAWAAASGYDAPAYQLAFALDTFLNRRGRWHDLATAGRAACAATQRLPDRSVQARAHRMLARAYTRLERLDAAHTHLRRALDLHRQAGTLAGQAHVHTDLALMCERQGDYARSLDHAEQALSLLRRTGDRHWQASALNLTGWYRVHVGAYQQAVRDCREALALHEEAGNASGQAATLDSLGYAHHHLDQHDRAITCYRRALDLLRATGDRPGEAETLTHLGETYDACGDLSAARAAWQDALSILTELEHPDADRIRARLAGGAG